MDAHDRVPIQILPEDLASQIAAGEVVERPASVVKELVENSLDAGATRIEVSIENGGIGLIQIEDDGGGIHPQDASLALVRHATSKLRAIDELETIASFGFRGEALASIASVSRVVIETRQREQQSGLRIAAEGTNQAAARPVGHPAGTTIAVRDLFFNVPARRKFLRSSNTESGHVADVVLDAALSRYDVSFAFSRDGRRVRSFERVDALRKRVAQVLGEAELLQIEGQRGPLSVEAYLAPVERSTRGAAALKVFVNGRPIKDRAIAATVAHAFGPLLERGRYPRGVVFLTLPQRLVDVNVHPQKTEVRFADARAVSDAVYGVIARAVSAPRAERSAPLPPARAELIETASAGATPVAPVSGAPSTEAQAQRAHAPLARGLTEARLSVNNRGKAPVSGQRYEMVGAPARLVADRASEAGEAPANPAVEARSSRGLRLLGQAKDAYLVCSSSDGVVTLDQHAADELGIYQRLSDAYRSGGLTSQSLLFPVGLQVNKRDSDLLEKKGALLLRLGLDVRVLRQGVAHLHAVPGLIKRATPEQLIAVFLEAARGSKDDLELLRDFFSRAACREAVAQGKSLSVAEAQAILRALPADDSLQHVCVHGRPVLHHLSYAELGRRRAAPVRREQSVETPYEDGES